MSKCKSCGAEIKWIKTTSGKMMPCNAYELYINNVGNGKRTFVSKDGEIIKADMGGDVIGAGWGTEEAYISHWETCPNADRHRKR